MVATGTNLYQKSYKIHYLGGYMNSRNRSTDIALAKYTDVEGLQQLLSLGRNTCLIIGKDSGALRKVGRRSLYCVDTVVNYIESCGSNEKMEVCN